MPFILLNGNAARLFFAKSDSCLATVWSLKMIFLTLSLRSKNVTLYLFEPSCIKTKSSVLLKNLIFMLQPGGRNFPVLKKSGKKEQNNN